MMRTDVTYCPHEERTRVEHIVGKKKVVIETCQGCAAGLLPKLFSVKNKCAPFSLRISNGESTLVLQGAWEGVPRYLTAKELGPLIESWKVEDDGD
jgi:hypothetical protein